MVFKADYEFLFNKLEKIYFQEEKIFIATPFPHSFYFDIKPNIFTNYFLVVKTSTIG